MKNNNLGEKIHPASETSDPWTNVRKGTLKLFGGEENLRALVKEWVWSIPISRSAALERLANGDTDVPGWKFQDGSWRVTRDDSDWSHDLLVAQPITIEDLREYIWSGGEVMGRLILDVASSPSDEQTVGM